MTAPIEGAVNVMAEPWFDPGHYRSDSNQHWRHGCPHEQLARGEFEWLQLLTHPEIWAYDGATMGETMRSFLDADRAGPARAPPRRPDRSRMKPITVVVTASGAPGTAALLRGLRENGEREVRLVGTDMSERSIGRHLCDAFHLVPAGSDPAFPDAIAEIAEREGAAAILPQSSFDLEGLAGSSHLGGAAVLVSSPDAIHRSNDKAESYAFLRRLGLPAPDFRRVKGAAEVEAAARELGYPERPVCFKPVFSSGSRGFRILDPTVDRADQLLRERPGSVSMLLEDAVEILASVDDRTDLLVMELATGPERTIDGIANGTRDRARPPEDARGDARRPRDVLRHARGSGADGARERDRRRARDRALLQHPARRRPRDRDQPADLDDRLPGRPEPSLPRRQAGDRRDLRRRAPRARTARSARAGQRCAISTSSSSMRVEKGTVPWTRPEPR